MVDVIIVAILVCIIGGILYYLYRAKKQGEVCIGCPYGRQCTGHCGRHGQETKHKKKH